MFRNINQYSIRMIFVSSFKFGFVYTNFDPLLFWFLNTKYRKLNLKECEYRI